MSKVDSNLLSRRVAAVLALVAFALALVAGLQTGNTFSTTVTRALIAMIATFALGLIVGAMAQRMLDENLKDAEKKLRDFQAETPTHGR
jgi:NhaP-type Na+/H+ or K+/H+ antiporter